MSWSNCNYILPNQTQGWKWYKYYLSVRPVTERVRHSNGKIIFESKHLISVTIRTTLVSKNSINVEFLWSKYDEYHYSAKKYTFCVHIWSENSFRERKIISICIHTIRSVFIPTKHHLSFMVKRKQASQDSHTIVLIEKRKIRMIHVHF
jgi:hypothetical protein